MRAIAVTEYGPISNLHAIAVPKPPEPTGFDVLISVKATSLNPIDTKVRAGIYDDYPTYYERSPSVPQILGFDGAGVVSAVGPDASSVGYKPGDHVFYSGSPIRQGANAEYQLVDARSVAHKPKSLDFAEAAALPLTWITAWESLVERLEIKKGERSGILIVNGAGGVGSVASQIARHILQLPVVVTTTSRPETTAFSKDMGATHTVNHHGDIVKQIEELQLDVPIRYVFITHSTTPYIAPAAAVCAPFGKVCTIVQTKELPMYGTEWMAKSMTFVWGLLGTKAWYGVDLESHGQILRKLADWIDDGVVRTHLKERLPLTADGIRKAHELVQGGKLMGKCALEVEGTEGRAFA
ncbi:quinone oxidoreductase [Saccharata proteae CBS 121410]|uniref:Quinone oxidoreductase n=1 Tax=Saccharata proteae CBS 121410 TaxID=1314787 RepID=A0A9P4HRB3_9PEZI|nr:quinone oxidoreductase [Saccharata proteae CBS 121410]